MNELALEEEEAEKHDDAALVQTDQHPQEEGFEGERATLVKGREEGKEG